MYQHKELCRKFDSRWLRTHVPVEIKATNGKEEMLSGIVQLSRYMRTMLAKQLDRRFAIGLLLCDSKLTVWLCDRSGLVGTRTAIDIHDVRLFVFLICFHLLTPTGRFIFIFLFFVCYAQEPEKFIQVIISLSRLNPSRLGYDTTMRIYRMDTATYHLSTDNDVNVDDYGASPHETTWAIQGP